MFLIILNGYATEILINAGSDNGEKYVDVEIMFTTICCITLSI